MEMCMQSSCVTLKSCFVSLKPGSRFLSKTFLAATAMLLGTIAIPQAWAVTATTTALTLSASTVATGTAVTLTATVATTGGAVVTPGLVTFCNAAATHCDNSAILGTAQLTATGTAVLRFVPGIGTHSYKAVFFGTKSFTASTSPSSALTVTGPYPTVSSLTSTGAAGNYTLSSTVVGSISPIQFPTGTMSFEDTTNGNYVVGTALLGATTTALNFSAATPTSATNNLPEGSTTGDFNNDGKLDLVVVAEGGISVLLGTGNGTFTPAKNSPFAAGNTPFAVAVGDFNNDGNADLAITNLNGSNVSIFFGKGDGTFQTQATFVTGTEPNAIAVGDFNNDGNADLAVTSQNGNTVTVYLNNGAGGFSASTTTAFALPYNPSGIVVGDFNGDGYLDVAVTDMWIPPAPLGDGVDLTVLLGEGNGNFIQASGSPIDVGRLPAGAAVGDFNGDGVPDIAVASANDNVAYVLIGNGDGTFKTKVSYPVGSAPSAIAVADFNGDGFADLSVATPKSATLGQTQSVLIGNGDGTFKTSLFYPVGFNGTSTVTGDFNGDGNPDIATPIQAATGQAGNTVTVLLDQITQTTTTTLA